MTSKKLIKKINFRSFRKPNFLIYILLNTRKTAINISSEKRFSPRFSKYLLQQNKRKVELFSTLCLLNLRYNAWKSIYVKEQKYLQKVNLFCMKNFVLEFKNSKKMNYWIKRSMLSYLSSGDFLFYKNKIKF